MTTQEYGKVQLKIMQVLWRLKRATAREILTEINKELPLTHSTVYTLIRMLEKKGAVDHDVDDRTFIFYPLVKSEKVMDSMITDVIERVFGGSVEGMVSYLLKNQYISKDEIDRISDLIDDDSD